MRPSFFSTVAARQMRIIPPYSIGGILNGKLPVEQWRAVYSDLGIDLVLVAAPADMNREAMLGGANIFAADIFKVQPQSLYELTAVLAGQEVVAAMRVGDTETFVEVRFYHAVGALQRHRAGLVVSQLIPKGKAPQARAAALAALRCRAERTTGLLDEAFGSDASLAGLLGDGGGFDESLLTLDDALADTSLIFDGAAALGDDAALLLGLESGDSLFASTAADVDAALDPGAARALQLRHASDLARARFVPAADRQADRPSPQKTSVGED